MNQSTRSDLIAQSHLTRIAVENYNDLRAAGESHETASERVGINKAKWQNIASAQRRREARV